MCVCVCVCMYVHVHVCLWRMDVTVPLACDLAERTTCRLSLLRSGMGAQRFFMGPSMVMVKVTVMGWVIVMFAFFFPLLRERT